MKQKQLSDFSLKLQVPGLNFYLEDNWEMAWHLDLPKKKPPSSYPPKKQISSCAMALGESVLMRFGS